HALLPPQRLVEVPRRFCQSQKKKGIAVRTLPITISFRSTPSPGTAAHIDVAAQVNHSRAYVTPVWMASQDFPNVSIKQSTQGALTPKAQLTANYTRSSQLQNSSGAQEFPF
ncbi:MAG TPA: hypothetical protein VED87_04525, partial [Methylocystis sp.]|nr:hypothetical protein [Methylocystis sp.]